MLQAYALSDLFQDDEIKNFRRSVSSIHWRDGPVYVLQDQKSFVDDDPQRRRPGVSNTVSVKKKSTAVEIPISREIGFPMTRGRSLAEPASSE